MKCPHCLEEVTAAEGGVCRFCGTPLSQRSDPKSEKGLDSDAVMRRREEIRRAYRLDEADGAVRPTGDLSALLHRCVVVKAEDSQGAGFFLPDGRICTAAHVVTSTAGSVGGADEASSTSDIPVTVIHDGVVYAAEVVKLDRVQDIAILSFRDQFPPMWRQYVSSWGSSRHLTPGERLLLVGNGRGLGLGPNWLSLRFPVRQDPSTAHDREVLLLNGSTHEGDSGGAIFNRYGQIVGMFIGSLSYATEIFVTLEVEDQLLNGSIEAPLDHSGLNMGVTAETIRGIAEGNARL